MTNEIFDLKTILDLQKWQSVQDAIARATKMAIITVDYRGRPVTEHSCCHPFCQSVRADERLSSYCQKCDARGGLEAVRQNAPYIYYCHFGIIDIAVPIMVAEKYIGAIMVGQVRLHGREGNHLEQIARLPEDLREFSTEKWQRLYAAIPLLSFAEVNVVAEMLYHLSSYIVEQALEKSLITELYQKNLRGNAPSLDFSDVISGYQAGSIEQARRVMNNSLLNQYLQGTAQDELCPNPILQPVLTHLHAHKGENLPLKRAAALCHLSSSYFSRLFAREMGQSYSVFVSRLKIEWGKRLLLETDRSISQISEELGFSEPSYFIKTFRRFESTTPALFRKYYVNS